MFKKLFKAKKENTATKAKTEKAKVEKLDTKELGNVVGGSGIWQACATNEKF